MCEGGHLFAGRDVSEQNAAMQCTSRQLKSLGGGGGGPPSPAKIFKIRPKSVHSRVFLRKKY